MKCESSQTERQHFDALLFFAFSLSLADAPAMTAAPPLALPAGFFLLPISLTGDAPCQPHLYVKVHRDDDDDANDDEEEASNQRRRKTGGSSVPSPPPPPHAVFVVGLPLLWRPLAPVLESLFGAYGGVEAVAVHPDQVIVFTSFSFRMPKRRRRRSPPPSSNSSFTPPTNQPLVLRHRLVLLAKGPADPGGRGSSALGRDATPAPSFLHVEEGRQEKEREEAERQ